MSIVVGDSDSSQIGEQGQEDDEVSSDSLVDDDHGSGQVDFQMQAKGDTILDVGLSTVRGSRDGLHESSAYLHTLEDLAGDLDSIDNSAETGGKEDDIGSSLGSFRGTLDGNTAVGLLE